MGLDRICVLKGGNWAGVMVKRVHSNRRFHVSQEQVTQLLVAWSQGDEKALAELVPIVEGQLCQIARRHMRQERPGHTLQTTALVNEACIKLIKADKIQWQSRAHFSLLPLD
jgi:hypothetical protein